MKRKLTIFSLMAFILFDVIYASDNDNQDYVKCKASGPIISMPQEIKVRIMQELGVLAILMQTCKSFYILGFENNCFDIVYKVPLDSLDTRVTGAISNKYSMISMFNPKALNIKTMNSKFRKRISVLLRFYQCQDVNLVKISTS